MRHCGRLVTLLLAAFLPLTWSFAPAPFARLSASQTRCFAAGGGAPPACASRRPAPLLAVRAPRRGVFALRAQQRAQECEAALKLSDESTRKLFAWLSRAFEGDMRYNNLMRAFAACFGDDAADSEFGASLAAVTKRPGVGEAIEKLVNDALAVLPEEDDAVVGVSYSLREREQGCLGAMGAGQWTGQWRTRPHALLDVRELTSVEEWVKSLPRGARRTLARANAQNFTVVARPIRGDEVAPHSSLAHFRCVLEHEVRLLGADDFFGAVQHAIGRYQNCIAQGGEIREYRDADGRVIGFSHEVTKGRVIRGQWFYATDVGAKSFVWFHSVQDLVRRAIEEEGVDHADLGPSGTDAFSELKEKYGFVSVSDWHRVADYRGPFRYSYGEGGAWKQLDPPDWLFEPSLFERVIGRDPRGL